MAPGLRNDSAAFTAAHHLMLAHGLAVRAVRAVLPSSTQVSLTLNLAHVEPGSDSVEDAKAVRHADGLANRIFLDPALRGMYPDDIRADLEPAIDFGFLRAGDLETIAAPIDVLGVNYYTPTRVAWATPELRDQARGRAESPADPRPARYPATDLVVTLPPKPPTTAMGWSIAAPTLTALLRRVRRDYPDTPLMITENGAAFEDSPDEAGRVRDDDRIAYLRDHLQAVSDAIADGVDVRGYFVWSLLDNFEWAQGYSKRFGIVRVDYPTGRRIPKASADWYRNFIAGMAG
jgi:beta-glucosidase